MYCEKCGKKLPEGSVTCSFCHITAQEGEKETGSTALSRQMSIITDVFGGKNIPAFIVLPLIALVIFGAIRLIQYWGWRGFVEEYIQAIEAESDARVEDLYRWELIEAGNEKRQNDPHIPDGMFIYDSTLDYIQNNDKYYRHCSGKEVADWEVLHSSKGWFSLTGPSMTVEVYVEFVSSSDVIIRMNMERDSEGWYLTSGVYAGYATEDE